MAKDNWNILIIYAQNIGWDKLHKVLGERDFCHVLAQSHKSCRTRHTKDNGHNLTAFFPPHFIASNPSLAQLICVSHRLHPHIYLKQNKQKTKHKTLSKVSG